MSRPQGLLRTFSDICDTLDVIQVAVDDVLDASRRLVALKTTLFHVRYESNLIHKKGLVLLFHMRYSSLLYGKE